MDEFTEFLFDLDVLFALKLGKTYEEAIQEARENLRDEREWRREIKKLEAAAQ